jgi:hypothetical protein
MFIEREVREELNELSKFVYGVSSKWQSILDHGFKELVTETKTETVPGENGEPDTTKEIKVAVLKNGVNQYRIKRYSLEEVKVLLLVGKAQREAMIARYQEMQRQKQAEAKVQELAQGRVVG